MSIRVNKFLTRVLITIFVILALFSFNTQVATANTCYYLGGDVAGFVIDEKGAEIIRIVDVITKEGKVSPCKDAEVEVGDIIISINGKSIDNISDLNEFFRNYKKGELIIEFLRGKNKIIKQITPAKDINGTFKIGVLIKDFISGIGTITYYTSDKNFSALGHPICDFNGDNYKIFSGNIFNCSIIGVTKGSRGYPGELKGIFLSEKSYGNILANTNTGIKGNINCDLEQKQKIKIGNGKPGKAHIYCCVDGINVEKYSVSIVKAENNKNNKDYVIKITDNKLLKITGGIVQGMSGSPIVQNGKLIGAVTHVFINDSTRGYGININKMIKE